jgi:uncharacterized protein
MARFESYVQGTPNYVDLMTPDQRGAAGFYGSLFGWETTEEPLGDDGGYYITASIEGDSVAGIGGQMPELAGHPAFWNVYLACDDVDATTAKVEAAGARVNLWQANQHIGCQRGNEPGTFIWNECMTPDIPAATAFYAEILGMGSETMDMDEGTYTVLTNAEGRQIGGAMNPPMEGVPPHWSVYFNVEDVDATVAKALELGGQVVAPAFDVAGVGRMAVLADPQGAMFNLMSGDTTDAGS